MQQICIKMKWHIKKHYSRTEKGAELTGRYRKFHNDELHKSHSLVNTIMRIKSRMWLTWHVASMTEERDAYRVLVEETILMPQA